MSPRRHLLTAGVVWLLLSVIGVFLVAGLQVIPKIASREAEIQNGAFVALTVASVPVLMLVVVALVYSAIRFRAVGVIADGPPIHGHLGFQSVWLGASLALVIALFAYGSIGLIDIRGSQTADFEVKVTSEQWKWHFEYPTGVRSNELHIPVDRRVHLRITSTDVIHSLWVPAFGIKQDAVPGRQTDVYLTATHTGTYPAMCAELCGLGHTTMTTMAVVSEQADLDLWLSQPHEPGPGPQ